MTAQDRRLIAARPDLADARLRGQIEAARFVAGEPAWVAAAVLDLKRAPELGAGMDTQLLRGAPVEVFERRDGWAWLRSLCDGYVGYALDSDLSAADPAATHLVIAPRTFLYPGPDLRLARAGALSMGASVTVVSQAETRGTGYAVLADGTAVIAGHVRPAGHHAADYVAVAETLVNTPYLWGGASGFGIDCSGLVQLSLRLAGVEVPRDTDQQEGSVGVEIDPSKGVQRGDLVFWKGHVAIMTDTANMIHANGHTMLVTYEPLAAAVDRIGYLYGQPTSFRRP